MSTRFPPNAQVNDEFEGYRFNGTAWKIIGVRITGDYVELVNGDIPDEFISENYVKLVNGVILDELIPVTVARIDDISDSLQSQQAHPFAVLG